ncbi:bifunctional chorismate mutase/prephenate dehydrogenase [Enterobacteriaceae endosymbiont of Donacia tomentosa]|uniref:bifunctional chorismate mutase/prephenate dehydrogenase n=1 Tax=Enterobacteriaceae endosymbiont of Donacia tomentosa TaxID=2675787 RepID=UPI0014497B65|nr:bifunctional chorismate mutase/prephenate dehydrogenase [Enterobacteriaceae endosymbiont of Donacia tomentosa]QJC31807.1 bifunctional chorismate mutase/prephenate dehydrogenase [Enterobacteriaceae endosymbiont of Donacia tomentosa]
MVKELVVLRNKIDLLDTKLLKILAKRLALVKKIGIVKNIYGLPVYIPEREKYLIESKKKEAQKIGISPYLIEDILNRIIYESYLNEKEKGFKKLNPNFKKILIIGGKGKMGNLFRKMLIMSGYIVNILDKRDWENNDNINNLFLNVEMIIISVPISSFNDVISKLPILSKNCILIDVTSIKNMPMKKMLEKHKGPVLGLHPMFSPENNILARQLILYCNGRNPESYHWFLKQMQIWGVKLQCINSIEHDNYMAFIQSLRYFTTLVYGFFLLKQNIKLKKLLMFSTPIYYIDLILLGKFFSQDSKLYTEIIMSSHNNIKNIKKYLHNINYIFSLIKKGNKAEIINIFNKVKILFKNHILYSKIECDKILRYINNN